jgi:type IV secretory pathway VirB10-like protein
MKKIISFIALVACGVIAFLYLGKDTVNTTQSTKQELPISNNKTNQKLLPEQKTPSPVKNTEIPPPSAPAHRQYTPAPAVPDEIPVTAGRRTNPEPETEEGNSEEPLSYPIEDAEIYFVPPEQRYPGNLGGPPPLNIPDQDFPEQ